MPAAAGAARRARRPIAAAAWWRCAVRYLGDEGAIVVKPGRTRSSRAAERQRCAEAWHAALGGTVLVGDAALLQVAVIPDGDGAWRRASIRASAAGLRKAAERLSLRCSRGAAEQARLTPNPAPGPDKLSPPSTISTALEAGMGNEVMAVLEATRRQW